MEQRLQFPRVGEDMRKRFALRGMEGDEDVGVLSRKRFLRLDRPLAIVHISFTSAVRYSRYGPSRYVDTAKAFVGHALSPTYSEEAVHAWGSGH